MRQNQIDFYFHIYLSVILYRWDCAGSEDPSTIESALHQHVTRTSQFLISNLKVESSINELQKKMFFISAKEVLNERPEIGSDVHLDLMEKRVQDWHR